MTETFKKLTDFEHARIRTSMYFGDMERIADNTLVSGDGLTIKEMETIPSIWVAMRELIDNSLDEIIGHSHGSKIMVEYHEAERRFVIEDDGRGIPIHEIKELGKGKPAASILLGEARTGRNFDDRRTVAGVNGLGAAIVNFTSEWFKVDVYRDNKHFHQEWSEKKTRGAFKHHTDGPNLVNRKSTKTGTRIECVLSKEVWPDFVLPEEFVASRIRDIAFANPGLKVIYNGKRVNIKTPKDMFHKHVSTAEVKSEGFEVSWFMATVEHDGIFVHSTINNIYCPNGGPHTDEFRNQIINALMAAMDSKVKAALGLKRNKSMVVTKGDVSSGILIYGITRMSDPQFNSQSKTRLMTNKRHIIKSAFTNDIVNDFIKSNPEWVEKVIAICKERIGTVNNRALINQQKKMKSDRVPNLRPATNIKNGKCILFITEGLSASTGITEARDASIHGVLPLTGKIMNVKGNTPKKVLENAAIKNILVSIGLIIGEKANRQNLNYDKVYICTDADTDGYNICSLLVNLFYQYWPELFHDQENPFLYHLDTPLIIGVKNKKRKYLYNLEYDQDDITKMIDDGYSIIRAKGLARLTREDWDTILQSPKIVPFTDDEHMVEVLEKVFSPNMADERKEWLS